MIVVLDIPDAAAHTAVALVERVNGAVRNFREIACVEASVHRISLFTDDRYAGVCMPPARRSLLRARHEPEILLCRRRTVMVAAGCLSTNSPVRQS